jgi:hypothetical protein
MSLKGNFCARISNRWKIVQNFVESGWKQRDKNQPKSTVKNQPPPTIDTRVRVRLKPDSKERVFRPEQKPAYIFSLCC